MSDVTKLIRQMVDASRIRMEKNRAFIQERFANMKPSTDPCNFSAEEAKAAWEKTKVTIQKGLEPIRNRAKQRLRVRAMKWYENNMKTKQRAKIEFNKTKAGGQKGAWRYRIKGANGEILIPNEGYTTKQDAERGLSALVLVILDYAFNKAQQMIKRSR